MKNKKILKISAAVTATCLIVIFTFLIYFYTIGIPKTQARNYYNLALEDIQSGNLKKAEEKLKKALSYWEEEYIKIELKSVQDRLER